MGKYIPELYKTVESVSQHIYCQQYIKDFLQNKKPINIYSKLLSDWYFRVRNKTLNINNKHATSDENHGLCIFIAYLIGWRLVVFLPCCSCSLVNCGGRCIRTLPWNWLDQLKPSSALNYKGTPTDICLPWRGIPKTWKLSFLVAMTIFCNVSKKCFALHTSKHEILISKSAQRL